VLFVQIKYIKPSVVGKTVADIVDLTVDKL